jgi:hypothetical protein
MYSHFPELLHAFSINSICKNVTCLSLILDEKPNRERQKITEFSADTCVRYVQWQRLVKQPGSIIVEALDMIQILFPIMFFTHRSLVHVYENLVKRDHKYFSCFLMILQSYHTSH